MTALPARTLTAALLALLLGVRLLSPAGFMPSFEHGAVTIVACPDAGPAPAHHDQHRSKSEQPCPYAAASALGMLGDAVAFLLALLIFAFLWAVPASAQSPGEQHWPRPPATGPPLLN